MRGLESARPLTEPAEVRVRTTIAALHNRTKAPRGANFLPDRTLKSFESDIEMC